jgi:hypothetical protein
LRIVIVAMTLSESNETTALLPHLPDEKPSEISVVQNNDRGNDETVGHSNNSVAQIPSSVVDYDALKTFQILGEIIGARRLSAGSSALGSSSGSWSPSKKDRKKESSTATTTLPASASLEASSSSSYYCYCVAQFGSKKIHRTKTTTAMNGNPLWTIKQSPLFIISVGLNDLRNHKNLVLTLWGQRDSKNSKRTNLSPTTTAARFIGKVRVKANDLIHLCHEQRIELDLVDDLGRPVRPDQANANDSDTNDSCCSQLAVRFRFASAADVKFANLWNHATQFHSRRIPRTVLQGCQVVPQEDRSQAILITELEGWEVAGASFATAVTSNMRLSRISPTKRRKRQGMIRVKPCPDPQGTGDPYLSPTQLKEITLEPSRQWVETGSTCSSSSRSIPDMNENNCKKLGRLFVEVLSCHNLPNVDYGNAVGNQTDAFVTLIYGDAMAQTPILDDELSPHWPPWTQRAFVFGMLHPSHTLYVAVFGYKRGVFSHVPIGRCEINPLTLQQPNTEYTLEYDLFPASHVMNRDNKNKSNDVRPRIRIRIRQDVEDPRAFLLAALQPPPPIYLNCFKKSSYYVAKYTTHGEYDNLDTFNLPVLLAYIDEIIKGFLRRILYAMNDGVKAVVIWKAPLHSFLFLTMGILAVERPRFIPAFLFFCLAYVMLVNMSLRRKSPSPWYRCCSFWHYLFILVFGSVPQSVATPTTIDANEGWEAQCQKQEQWNQRLEKDDLFADKKGRLEKEIENIEKIATIETIENRTALLSVELLDLLGKIQGIFGRIIRFGRTLDNIITWEQSDRSFWLTTALLTIGVVFLFVPWALVFTWSGRFFVILLLGPQNKFLHLYWRKYHADEEGKLRQMFEERIFRARCKQEDVSKLRAFRQIIFGRYGIAVPDLSWTPHLDRPGPGSRARPINHDDELKENTHYTTTSDDPCIPGQKLHGVMIPRPHDRWLANNAESEKIKERVLEAAADLQLESPEQQMSFGGSQHEDNTGLEEEGVEVSDIYDIESALSMLQSLAGDKRNSVKKVTFEESLRGDWGVEAVDMYEDEAMFVQNSWQFLSSTANILNLSSSSSEGDSNSNSSSDHSGNTTEEKKTALGTLGRISSPLKQQWIQSQPEGSSLVREWHADDDRENDREKIFRRSDPPGGKQGGQSQGREECRSQELNLVQEEEEEDSTELQESLNGPEIPEIPALTTVRTFEVDPGSSMSELGFETTFGEDNDIAFSVDGNDFEGGLVETTPDKQA